MGNENNVKICPFSGEACNEEKCALWTEIAVARSGMIAPQKESMCAFQAMVLTTGSPKPMMVPKGMKLPSL
jgi:hypothetical protein